MFVRGTSVCLRTCVIFPGFLGNLALLEVYGYFPGMDSLADGRPTSIGDGRRLWEMGGELRPTFWMRREPAFKRYSSQRDGPTLVTDRVMLHNHGKHNTLTMGLRVRGLHQFGGSLLLPLLRASYGGVGDLCMTFRFWSGVPYVRVVND